MIFDKIGKISIGIIFLLGLSLNAQSKVQSIRLNDGWNFIRQDIGDIWEAVRPIKEGNPEDYPMWTNVSLPHCFNAEDAVDPDVNYYQGPGWYRNLLDIDSPYEDGRVMLEFEGAGPKTEVYVYTTKVGEHVGGYDEWSVDITDAVADFKNSDAASRFGGKVPLSIRCDNSRDIEMIPSDMSDFTIYGGIYRYLNLVYLPCVSMSDLRIEPVLSDNMKTAHLSVKGHFYNPSDVREASVDVVIKDPDGKIVAENSHKGVTPLGEINLMNVELRKPAVWDVDAPQLYTAEVTVTAAGGQHVSTHDFGFRQFEFIDKGPFYLNGRRLLLRGTHRHEDHAGVGAAMTQEQMTHELKMMKEMGVNFIRLGHYQQSRIILNLCDSLGILVWEEIPWCRGGLGGEKYRSQAKRMLTNMINQHYNHPSAIIWGLGNENDWPGDFEIYDKGKIRAFMSELNTLAHNTDSSRKTAIRRCDFCSDIVDVYSPTIWAGWYRGNYEDYVKFSKEAFNKVRHFLHVEWGGDSHPGRHVEDSVPSKKDWSETYIVKLIDWHLKEQENMPWLTGAAYWPFKDFATPVRPDNPVPYVNQKGVLERDFGKKEAYYVFQSYWTDEPMVHILGHSMPDRWGQVDEEKECLVYSNCGEVELFLNGVSLGRKKRDSQDYPAAGLRWNVRMRPGDNIFKAVGYNRDGHQVSDEMTQNYLTTQWGKEDRLDVSVVDMGAGLSKVNVVVTDADGIPCLDSRRVIRFQLSGDGRLIKNLGTAGGSSKVEAANGRASVCVEGNNGQSVVAVMSPGLPTQFVTIK